MTQRDFRRRHASHGRSLRPFAYGCTVPAAGVVPVVVVVPLVDASVVLATFVAALVVVVVEIEFERECALDAGVVDFCGLVIRAATVVNVVVDAVLAAGDVAAAGALLEVDDEGGAVTSVDVDVMAVVIVAVEDVDIFGKTEDEERYFAADSVVVVSAEFIAGGQ